VGPPTLLGLPGRLLPPGKALARVLLRRLPFSATAGSKPELITRWRDQPSAAADAIELEYSSLAVNPRIGAFGVGKTAHELARQAGLDRAIAIARHRIKSRTQWTLVEVRRFFTAKDDDPGAKGLAWRSVSVIQAGTRKQMLAAIRSLPNTELEIDAYGTTRAWRRRLPQPGQEVQYPVVEWIFAVVPADVQDKKRPGFEAQWNRLTGPTLF
jgi:hypothetical protein